MTTVVGSSSRVNRSPRRTSARAAEGPPLAGRASSRPEGELAECHLESACLDDGSFLGSGADQDPRLPCARPNETQSQVEHTDRGRRSLADAHSRKPDRVRDWANFGQWRRSRPPPRRDDGACAGSAWPRSRPPTRARGGGWPRPGRCPAASTRSATRPVLPPQRWRRPAPPRDRRAACPRGGPRSDGGRRPRHRQPEQRADPFAPRAAVRVTASIPHVGSASGNCDSRRQDLSLTPLPSHSHTAHPSSAMSASPPPPACLRPPTSRESSPRSAVAMQRPSCSAGAVAGAHDLVMVWSLAGGDRCHQGIG